MNGTQRLMAVALMLMLGSLAESLIPVWSEPEPERLVPIHPIHPIHPICKPTYQPICHHPYIKKCKYYGGCPSKCYCHYECPKPYCLSAAAHKCQHGVLLDKKGCLTCTCRPPCCPIRYKGYCYGGYIYSLDKKGCPVSKCKY